MAGKMEKLSTPRKLKLGKPLSALGLGHRLRCAWFCCLTACARTKLHISHVLENRSQKQLNQNRVMEASCRHSFNTP